MTSERIKQIQETTAYPESVSVKQGLLQVWNECAKELSEENKRHKKEIDALNKEMKRINNAKQQTI